MTQNPIAKVKILIVDDEQDICELLKDYLSDDYHVSTSITPTDAIAKIKEFNFDLLITDFKMPEMDGYELINEASKLNTSLKYILISGHIEDTSHFIVNGKKNKVHFMAKPFSRPEHIINFIEKALLS